MAVFNSYYVFPVKSRLIELKKDFISSRDSYKLCSVTSKNKNWFTNNNGIYDVKSEDNFKLDSIQDNILCLYFINEFIRKGFVSNYRFNAVRQDNELYFILSWLGIGDESHEFNLTKAALLSEDIYNIYMILARRFLCTTTPEDLSKYKDLFRVFEVPGQVINTSSIEQDYRSGVITLDEMNEKISLIEREQSAILSLRR